ncbi:hypothetical protein JDFR1000234_44 [uncultured archaeal virus]|jgi:hypothetical protein|uniref:Uncharacterized protein n=1 Tax=uncultured archaeal virus TaxID=1960247 RepID=A0A1S5Y344_9VIRU|nr:hypothetical protein JDFR1000234_44 [uncultured archaeal virus]
MEVYKLKPFFLKNMTAMLEILQCKRSILRLYKRSREEPISKELQRTIKRFVTDMLMSCEIELVARYVVHKLILQSITIVDIVKDEDYMTITRVFVELECNIDKYTLLRWIENVE